MKNILITGGDGFIGSNLYYHLKYKNRVVLYLGDVSREITIKNTFDTIFHMAANSDTLFDDNVEMMRNNINGFLNVIDFAKKNKSTLVYASSAALYGNGKVPMKEDQKLYPLNAYSYSKYIQDLIAEKLFPRMHLVGLRYFNVFGMGEGKKGRSASMVWHIMEQIRKGERPKLFFDGEQKRDHVYIKDVVRATILAAKAESGIYNVGSGIPNSYNRIVDIINGIYKTDLEPIYFKNPYEEVYQNFTHADISKLKRATGYMPKYSLQEAIIEYAKNS